MGDIKQFQSKMEQYVRYQIYSTRFCDIIPIIMSTMLNIIIITIDKSIAGHNVYAVIPLDYGKNNDKMLSVETDLDFVVLFETGITMMHALKCTLTHVTDKKWLPLAMHTPWWNRRRVKHRCILANPCGKRPYSSSGKSANTTAAEIPIFGDQNEILVSTSKELTFLEKWYFNICKILIRSSDFILSVALKSLINIPCLLFIWPSLLPASMKLIPGSTTSTVNSLVTGNFNEILDR